METIYNNEDSKKFLKDGAVVQLIDHAIKVITNHFGDPKLTRFELMQAIHTSLPYLKHIVYRKVEGKWSFIFKDNVGASVDIHRV